LKIQTEYDQLLLGLLNRLEHILSFADIVADKIVADKIVCEEMDPLEEIIPRMYEVMHKVAKVSCDHVKYGSPSSDDFGTIEEADKQLTRVAGDFDRAVNVEALRQIKETGKHSFSHSLDGSFATVPCRAAPFI
jgi:hypothetical protein